MPKANQLLRVSLKHFMAIAICAAVLLILSVFSVSVKEPLKDNVR